VTLHFPTRAEARQTPSRGEPGGSGPCVHEPGVRLEATVRARGRRVRGVPFLCLGRRPDGTQLDPWLRTRERLGADIAKVASESVLVTGTVVEWEEWTEMALPESGAYVVSGALVPIEIDRERDEGIYVEPNVWMVHPPPRATEP
jgi:hypothetical protein